MPGNPLTFSSSKLGADSAESFIPSETFVMDWKIRSFRDLVDIACIKKRKDVATLPFEMGASLNFGTEKKTVSFLWKVTVDETPSFDIEVDPPKRNIGIYLNAIRNDTEQAKLWPNLIFKYKVENIVNGAVVKTLKSGDYLLSWEGLDDWGFRRIFNMVDAWEYYDPEGNLTFKLYVTLYYEESKPSLTSTHDVITADLTRQCQEELVKDISSLYNDQETCDMKFIVVDETNAKSASEFPFHSAIISARSRVFQAMLSQTGMAEKREGIVRISDVSAETVEYFLYFIYTGQLQDRNTSNDPSWTKHLPELVYMADKYEIQSLLDFCDGNFHLGVNEANAADMFLLTKRHHLVKAESRLRMEFSKNLELLIGSLSVS